MNAVAAAHLAWWGEVDNMGKKKPGKHGKKAKAPETAAHCTDRVRTMRQPHRRTLAASLRGDERAESPFGRLVLRDEIDRDQYEAGNIFAGKVSGYAATIETPRSVSGTLGSLATSDYPDDAEEVDHELAEGCAAEFSGGAGFCRDNPDKCECLARRNSYMRAYEALMDTRLEDGRCVGRAATMAVSRVVVHRQEIAQEDLVYLKRGLDALVAHFGLLARGKRAD